MGLGTVAALSIGPVSSDVEFEPEGLHPWLVIAADL
jgi:hypothetical protein